MKKILIGLVALPFIAGTATAADRLSDQQLDTVTAGALVSIDCPGCTLASSNSMSNNGVTTSASSTVTVPVPGGTGGGTGGGGGGGGSGGGTGNPGPTGPGVVSTIAVPPALAAIVNGASTVIITH